MSDPVVCSDGHTYERSAIEEWLLSHFTSPVTNMRLHHNQLVPNYSLRNLIETLKNTALMTHQMINQNRHQTNPPMPVNNSSNSGHDLVD
jgi:hypothetical protein